MHNVFLKENNSSLKYQVGIFISMLGLSFFYWCSGRVEFVQFYWKSGRTKIVIFISCRDFKMINFRTWSNSSDISGRAFKNCILYVLIERFSVFYFTSKRFYLAWPNFSKKSRTTLYKAHSGWAVHNWKWFKLGLYKIIENVIIWLIFSK